MPQTREDLIRALGYDPANPTQAVPSQLFPTAKDIADYMLQQYRAQQDPNTPKLPTEQQKMLPTTNELIRYRSTPGWSLQPATPEGKAIPLAVQHMTPPVQPLGAPGAQIRPQTELEKIGDIRDRIGQLIAPAFGAEAPGTRPAGALPNMSGLLGFEGGLEKVGEEATEAGLKGLSKKVDEALEKVKKAGKKDKAELPPPTPADLKALTQARKAVSQYEKQVAASPAGQAPPLPGAAPFAKYGHRYPPVGAPELAFDKNKQSYYIARAKKDPLNRDLLDQRGAIQSAMDDQGVKTSANPTGWVPMFDPEKPYMASGAANHQLIGDLTASHPKRPKFQAAEMDVARRKVQTPENIDRALEYAKVGLATRDPKTGLAGAPMWYGIGQFEDWLKEVMGNDAGLKRFREITQGLASTTSGATPPVNLISTMYGLYLKNHGLPIPTGPGTGAGKGAKVTMRSYAMPTPTSGERLVGNMKEFDEVINQGLGITAETNPKRWSFDANLAGHNTMSTVDQQYVQAITPDFQEGDHYDPKTKQWGEIDDKGKFTAGKITHPNAPPGRSYFAYDEVSDMIAPKLGITKEQAQAAVWVGKKYLEEGIVPPPMIQVINDMIERTMRATGSTNRDATARSIFAYPGNVKGSAKPAYGFLLGAMGLGAAAEAERRSKEQ